MSRERFDEADIERHAAAAMRDMGWLSPTRAGDVTEALEQTCADAPLPDCLLDAQRVLDGSPRDVTGVGHSLIDPAEAGDVDAGLRRAAREGGDLLPEVLEAMRRDREATRRAEPPNDPPPDPAPDAAPE